MLSAYEKAICAACAENYPKGHGQSFLSTIDVISFSKAVSLIENDPTLIQYGWPAITLAAVRSVGKKMEHDILMQALNDITDTCGYIYPNCDRYCIDW
jgi:hypothetical protein